MEIKIRLESINESIKSIESCNREFVQFNDEEHRYFFCENGKTSELMGVSKFISVSKFSKKFEEAMKNSKFLRDNMPYYQWRGNEVHFRSETLEKKYIETGDLFECISPPDLVQYFKFYNEFLSTYLNPDKPRLKLLTQELMVLSSEGIIGTVDRLYFDNVNQKLILLDIKTGSEQDSHWLQQYTYSKILAEWGIKPDDIWLLSLKDYMSIKKWSNKTDAFKKSIVQEFKKVKQFYEK